MDIERKVMDIERKVRNYILENYLFTDDESALSDGDSFLEKGILDSTGVMELTLFLEEEFQIGIADDEFVPENLDSVANLTAFIRRKKGEGS